MYTYIFITSVRVIPVSAVLSRVPYGYDFLHMARIRGLHTDDAAAQTDPPPGRRARPSTNQVFGAVPRLNEWQIDSLFVTKMLAMALLLHGGLLGGMGGEAAGVDGSGEGAWTLATPAEGFLAASGTGELAHLLHLCLFRAFPRGASLRSQRLTGRTAYRRLHWTPGVCQRRRCT